MDNVDRATRSRMMAAIGSRGTAPELALARALRKARVRGWRRHERVLGHEVDFSWSREKIAVLVHGCFWHGCAHARMPKTNRAFWRKKIVSNRARDRRQTRILRENGWMVFTVWECVLRRSPARPVRRIRKAVESWGPFGHGSGPEFRRPLVVEFFREWGRRVSAGNGASTFACMFLEWMRDSGDQETYRFRKTLSILVNRMQSADWRDMKTGLKGFVEPDVWTAFASPAAERFYEEFKFLVIEAIKDHWKAYLSSKTAEKA